MENKDEIKEIEISTSRMILKLLKLFLFSLLRFRFYIPGVSEIKVHQLYELIKSNQSPLILDTRDKAEFYALEGPFKKYGHIPNAKLLPIFQVAANLKHLSSFKDKKIVTICPGGGASLVVAEIMVKVGFTDVHSLRGGMNKWSRKGYPTTTAKADDDLIYLIEDSKTEFLESIAEVTEEKYMGEVHKTVDARNLSCPKPILKSKKAIDALEINQMLEILATDPGSKTDIPAWAHVTGQELISIEENNLEEFRYIIRKLK